MNWPVTKESAKTNLRSLLKTWGTHVDILRIYVHRDQLAKHPVSESGLPELAALVEPVDMARSDDLVSRNIWEKMWRGWLRASRRYLDDADWFFKTDIDSFLVVENARAFLERFDSREPHYFGHTLYHEWEKFNLVFNSGVGYILSRETLRRYGMRLSAGMDTVTVQEKKYQCFDRPFALEDPNTGGCLRELGILPGDTLDSRGRQRFNLFRPRDLLFNMKYRPQDWYWKNKGSIGKNQLDAGCCSDTPIVWHNFKSGRGVFDPQAFDFLEYIYHSQNYASRVAAMDADPPSKTLYQFNRGELSFPIDKDRNCDKAEHAPAVRVAAWLRKQPAAKRACFESGSQCACDLPSQLPYGMVGKGAGGCSAGGRLGHGETCAVECGPDASSDSGRDDHMSHSREFACDGGHLLYPKLMCRASCKVPARAPEETRFARPAGTTVVHGDTLSIECPRTRGRSASARCIEGKFFGNLRVCTGNCKRWSVHLKGSNYGGRWNEITHHGGPDDTFKVMSVPFGAELDTMKNCDIWHIDNQLVLVETSTGQDVLVAPLSCGNQKIHIVSVNSIDEVCTNVEF